MQCGWWPIWLPVVTCCAALNFAIKCINGALAVQPISVAASRGRIRLMLEAQRIWRASRQRQNDGSCVITA